MAELTHQQLVEMVDGKPEKPRAVFFEKAMLNVDQSRHVGHRVYDKRVYVMLSQPGVTDGISYVAQQADFDEYAEEYEYFLRSRQGTKVPGIEIVPNLDIAHLQELRDMGVLNIQQLAETEIIPKHLEYARDAAIVFTKALEETSHASQEESNREETRKAEDVPAEDRREHRHDVGRPEVPRGVRHREVRETPERDAPGRRPHRGEGVDWGAVRIL